MTISEKVAYLKGLAEGLNIDTEKSKEGKLINVMIGILEENSLALGEEIDVLSDDLADVEAVVFDDEDEDDYDEDEEEEFDDDWFEVECPNCEETLLIDEDALEEGVVECPNCGTRYSMDLSEDEEEAE